MLEPPPLMELSKEAPNATAAIRAIWISGESDKLEFSCGYPRDDAIMAYAVVIVCDARAAQSFF